MKTSVVPRPFRAALCTALPCLFMPLFAHASGTWTPLTTAPPTGVNNALLLSDGSVLATDGSGDCDRLTPDIHGSYINGTWTRLASMNYTRLFYASQVLTNGNVFVAGGEYGTGGAHAEIYNPVANTWTTIPDPSSAPTFSDAASQTLPNGNVLVAPVSQFGGCLIYNVAGNNWITAASAQNQNEVCWVKVANDDIITIDTGSQNAEHYVPSLNQWYPDNTVPVAIYGYGAEMGAGFLLPNGKVFYIGGSTNTAIYTPGSSVTSAGTWTAGPAMVFGTNQLGAVDAPAAMMVNGKVLCDLGPVGGFNGPCFFYEYDYAANSFTQVSAPGGGSTYNSVPYANSMLDLPDGSVLFIGGQNSQSLYVYTPNGSPVASGQPIVSSIAKNADGSYQLSGLGLNGISQGAAYGDDEQMNSNYPLIRMTNSVTGQIYYARSYNWNSTSVMTGTNQVLTTSFGISTNLPAGNYSVVSVANGIASAPVNFNPAYNQNFGVVTDGSTFTGGIDGVGSAYSANLLGSSLTWNGGLFTFGLANGVNVISCTGQTIPLPAAQSTSLLMLGTAINGNQTSLTFTVHYTDGTTANFTRSLSDWFTPQNYAGETVVKAMAYRDLSNGTKDNRTFNLYGYALDLNSAKTVSSITVPNVSNVKILGFAYTSGISVPLSSSFNRSNGRVTDGTTFTGGLDNGGYAYSANLLTSPMMWNDLSFAFGPNNAADVLSGTGQTVSLTAGKFSMLYFLGTAVNGNQPSQTFTVKYSDGSTNSYTVSLSDWFTPQNYTGETIAKTMSYRDVSNGTTSSGTLNIYGYGLITDSTKTISSLVLPNNANVEVLSITLSP